MPTDIQTYVKDLRAFGAGTAIPYKADASLVDLAQGDAAQGFRVEPVLGRQHARLQRLGRVPGQHRHLRLRQDRAVIVPCVLRLVSCAETV